MILRAFCVIILVLLPMVVRAQYKMSPEQYMATYSEVAIEEMKLYDIPASVTLAQGMFESGYGGSRLAVEANNHFGIKCGTHWSGPTINHDDDSRGECFRKYTDARESYRDHSLFLHRYDRYNALFKLKKNDYKGWAKGLKKAGYATDPRYAEKLIDIIERYELYTLDTKTSGVEEVAVSENINTDRPENRLVEVNGVKAVVAKEGETLSDLSQKYGVAIKRLLRYNDMPALMPISEGDVIFLKTKKTKNKEAGLHTAQKGDSRHSLAQKYGIRETTLRRLNPILKKREVQLGDIIRLN